MGYRIGHPIKQNLLHTFSGNLPLGTHSFAASLIPILKEAT